MVKNLSLILMEIIMIDVRIHKIFSEFFWKIVLNKDVSLTEIQIYRNKISILGFSREDLEEELPVYLIIFPELYKKTKTSPVALAQPGYSFAFLFK